MKIIHILSLSTFSFCAGLVVGSKDFSNDITKLTTMVAIGAIPSSFITYLITDAKAQKLINQSANQIQSMSKTLNKVICECDNYKNTATILHQQNIQLKNELIKSRNTIHNLGQVQLQMLCNIAELQSQQSLFNDQSCQHPENDKDNFR